MPAHAYRPVTSAHLDAARCGKSTMRLLNQYARLTGQSVQVAVSEFLKLHLPDSISRLRTEQQSG